MYSIPEEQLPNEWKDEVRLDSLFSPCRSKSVNPKDYESKITSWKTIISLYCTQNAVYSFTVPHLNNVFIRHGHPPSCLNIVVKELINSGELQYLENFLQKSPKSWRGWATDILFKRPISWSYNTIYDSLFSKGAKEDQTYVHLGVVRSEAQKLFSKFSTGYCDNVINLSDILDALELSKDSNQVQGVKLLLHYLSNENKVDISVLHNNNSYNCLLVKFMQDKFNPITEVDLGLYILEQNEKLFIKNVEELEDSIAECIKEVKCHLLKGHKELAKTCLKKKHKMYQRLTRKVNALHNVQTLLEKIKDVHTDAKVWNSYKHALSAFQATYKETGLSEDAVEDTMLKLGEVLDIHEDIQTRISQPLEEDEDLEAELMEYMKNEDTKSLAESEDKLNDLDEQLAKLNLDSLPKVPSSNVSIEESFMQ